MNREELSRYLFKKTELIEPYPELVAPISTMLGVTAFFPGGYGLWKEEASDVFPSVLILGQDFSTEDEYILMLQTGKNEINGPTWRNMRKLFSEAELNLSDCFFSNIFIGLRKTKSMVGKFPGSKDKLYVSRCLDFMALQIKTIEPKIIVTLGKYPSELLSLVSEDLNSWKNGKALSDPNNGFKERVNINGHICTCIALEHPSMRNSNVKRRIYGDKKGSEAEVAMLREALIIHK